MKYRLAPAPARAATSLLADLNPEQRAVVTAPPGPALVLAGAGSGKTRALTHRVAWLLFEGIPPERILLVTFTNRAAREMLRRVAALAGLAPERLRRLWAGTFHHVANQAVRANARLLGLPERYGILDREDARELCGRCLAEEDPKTADGPAPRAGLAQALLSLARELGRPLAEVLAAQAPRLAPAEPFLARVAARYARRKAELGLCDFDDLLCHWRRLMTEHAEPAARIRDRFLHVLCDEYQDTSPLQAELCDLCAAGHGSLMVVGDDAQSIYSFRGAEIAHMLGFADRHPGSRIYRLEASYRSTPEILELANRSIACNVLQHGKTLRATRPPGGSRPALVTLRDVYQQAAFVAQRTRELVDEGVALGEIAVLYRNHDHALELQVELVRQKIPHVVRSGLRFLEQAHIKDALAYLRVLHNPRDLLAWSRLLRLWRGIGARRAERLLGALAERGEVDALADPALAEGLPQPARAALGALARLLGQLEAAADRGAGPGALLEQLVAGHYATVAHGQFENPEARLSDLAQLAAVARQAPSLEAFLEDLALEGGLVAESVRPGEPADDALVLSSIHQAKGLEWRVVFLLWLCEGRLPQASALETPERAEEERRLFYVAVTRARDELYLLGPRLAETGDGTPLLLRPSRFLAELEAGGAPPPYDRWEIEEDPA